MKFQKESVNAVVNSMLKVSSAVYTFADLRKIVKEHDREIRNGEPAKESFFLFFEKDKPLVDFQKTDLIITQDGDEDNNLNRYLQRSITGADILEFIRLNRKLLDDKDGDIKLSKDATEEKLGFEALLEELSKSDSEIIDYDDHFTAGDGLVYALTVNRSKKRVTAIFRGTVGINDILTDANFFHSTPDIFKDCGVGDKQIKTHSGFSSYLFDKIPDAKREVDFARTKFDRMVAAIKEIYDEMDLTDEEKDEFELVVTGHSLGGGLANLFAFAIAKTQNHYKFFDHVTAVTFAAPVVGDDEYNKAFQDLEQKGLLHQLRLSNHGDVVPTQPVPGYTQNGVNLHLHDDKPLDLVYGNNKVLRPWWLLDWLFPPTVLEKHMFPEYEKRIKHKLNEPVFAKSFIQIYEEAMAAMDSSK